MSNPQTTIDYLEAAADLAAQTPVGTIQIIVQVNGLRVRGWVDLDKDEHGKVYRFVTQSIILWAELAHHPRLIIKAVETVVGNLEARPERGP